MHLVGGVDCRLGYVFLKACAEPEGQNILITSLVLFLITSLHYIIVFVSHYIIGNVTLTDGM